MSNIWEAVSSLVATGKLIAEDSASLIKAAIGAHHDLASGKAKTPLEALTNQSKTILPVIESVVGMLFPGVTAASIAVDAISFMIVNGHKMTPEEERRWMDRASQSAGQ